MAVASKKKLFDSRYEIVSIVGRGSRSVVYHAKNVSDDNTEVALKVLIENKKDKIALSEKLRREALALVSSHHPSVIRLDDFHSVGDICYLAMEYAPHSDLRKYIAKTSGSLDHATVQELLLQITDGLDYIHRTGIIHRDIKPDNLLVVSPTQFRIGDFGVAFLPGDSADPSELQNAVGTMDYMAPEVLEGIEYTQRSDIYSLGVTAYEVITGKNPFADVSMSNQLEVRKSLPPISSLIAGVPEYLSELIEKACAYDPKERFQSAKEILLILRSKKAPASSSVSDPEIKSDRPHLTVVNGSTKNSHSDLEEEQDSPAIMHEAAEAADQIGGEESEVMQSIPLKDSRASRTPTLFISKESVEMIREQELKAKQGNPANDDYGKGILESLTELINFPQLSNFAILVIGFSILLAVYGGYRIFAGSSATSSQYAANETGLYQGATDTSSLIPAYKGDALAFPALPTGVYSGAVTGIIGSSPIPLTIISFANKGRLAVVVGSEGFHPAIVEIGTKTSVKVVANGYIIELQGSANKGLIEGTVRNLVTGTNGAFKLRPSST